MTWQDADAGDVPAHAIGLGYAEAAIAAAEEAEERAWHAAAAPADEQPERSPIARPR